VNSRTLISVALAVTLVGLFAGANALADDSPAPGAQVQSQAQAPPPDVPNTPGAPDRATFKCPHCGAECPMPFGRAGRGMRGARGRTGQGRDFVGRGHDSRRGRGFGRGAHVPAERMLWGASRLELTDDQIAQLEKLSYDTKSKLIDLEANLDQARLEMKRQMETDNDNLSAMKKQLESISNIRVSIQELKLKNWIDARKVLTDEQKSKVKDQFPRFGSRL
jgi:Spy/CpxP family protein refolding chaperone